MLWKLQFWTFFLYNPLFGTEHCISNQNLKILIFTFIPPLEECAGAHCIHNLSLQILYLYCNAMLTTFLSLNHPSTWHCTGAAEPNAQGCAFVHPIFWSQVKKILVLRTENLTLSYKLRTQFWLASAAPVVYLNCELPLGTQQSVWQLWFSLIQKVCQWNSWWL